MVNILIVAGIFIVIWAVCLYQAYRRGWHDGRSAGITEREFRELAGVETRNERARFYREKVIDDGKRLKGYSSDAR